MVCVFSMTARNCVCFTVMAHRHGFVSKKFVHLFFVHGSDR